MIDEATESWEVVRQVPTLRRRENKNFFLTIPSRTRETQISVDFFFLLEPIIYRLAVEHNNERRARSVKKQRK